jgi:hypothetical protein
MSRKSQAANAPVRVGVDCSICDPAAEQRRAEIQEKFGMKIPGKEGSYMPIDRKEGIRGVPSTYVAAAERKHRESGYHKEHEGVAHMEDVANGAEPRTAVISGSLLDFTHGKEHNA